VRVMNSVFFLATSTVTNGPSGILTGVLGAGLFLAIVWLVIGIILFLFPFIVMLQLSWLNSKLKDLSIQHATESTKGLQWSMTVVTELKAQNALTRQLLRAYGHEPEA